MSADIVKMSKEISKQENDGYKSYCKNIVDDLATFIGKKRNRPLSVLEKRKLQKNIYGDNGAKYIIENGLYTEFLKAKLKHSTSSKALILEYISNSTYFTDEDKKIILNNLKQNLLFYANIINTVDYNNGKYKLDTKVGTITYYEASEKYFRDYPGLSNIITSRKRFNQGLGRCHELTYYGARFLYGDAVTGVIKTAPADILHSFIEKDNYVIDPAQNLVMKRSDYYQLTDVEVFNKITDKELDVIPEYYGSFSSLVSLALIKKSKER